MELWGHRVGLGWDKAPAPGKEVLDGLLMGQRRQIVNGTEAASVNCSHSGAPYIFQRLYAFAEYEMDISRGISCK